MPFVAGAPFNSFNRGLLSGLLYIGVALKSFVQMSSEDFSAEDETGKVMKTCRLLNAVL